MDGMELLERLHLLAPETLVIAMTAYGTVDSAVAAMKAGAWDYLLKPVQFDDLLLKVQRAMEFGELSRDRKVMSEQMAADSTFHNLVSEAPRMLELFEQVRKLSTVKSSVLLVGESGTGKELFARAIHYNGTTRGKPFVAVNSGAIPDTLIESELFGHRKGAFTGAVRDKIGFFEAANGGTIFLDEISVLPAAVQSTLLRAIEERVVTPVGDTQSRPIDVRIIAASNQDVEQMVRDGTFREDLFFRLNVVTLTLPPLRQRKGDIPLLVHHFLDKYTREMSKNVHGVTNAAMRALLGHDWPGNVRELENVIERACIFADGRQVGVEDLPFAAPVADGELAEDLKGAMSQFERQHIIYSLRRHNYDKAETAKVLGIGISSLYRKLEELKIPKNLEESDPEAGREPSQI
jgi:DNA-binding NtrC family response regulator